ncbi:Mitochondrial inner membrane protein [Lachnellula occidentalis]|uniref:Mitochondrial inner membrane protein n=1 Tax=Lachnellula occidentalis TaxID=215460 RepID=A0A8H8UKL0_9HELO|nr:Mitochondrial inner membrane protein [Lachnellula occidentalis]
MLASRGTLRWSGQAIGIGRRRLEPFSASARQFSSTVHQNAPIRGSPLLSQTRSSLARMPSTFRLSTTNFLMRNGAAVRFASSAPLPASAIPAPSTATNTPADAVSASSASSVDSVTLTSLDDLSAGYPVESLADVPHYLGYFKDLGLDYGWGPTAGMEWVLEHVHVLTGTPWWVSIAITSLLVRVALFKLYVNAADNGARMASCGPLTAPITAKMKEAQTRGDNTAVLKYYTEISAIQKKAGASMLKGFVPAIGGIATFGIFKFLRAASALPVPSMETGGILWFQNLTIPDPYFLLPLATSGMLHWLIRRGGETGVSTMTPGMLAGMMWGIPAISLIFTWWLPASVQLSFFVTGLLSFGQVTMMRQPWFRKAFKMVPLPTTGPKGSAPSPYKGTIKRSESPVLTQQDLNARFQNASSSFPRPPEAPKSAFKKMINVALKPLEPVKAAMSPVIASGKTMQEDQNKKRGRKDAQKYEAKRNKEVKREREARAEAVRQKRALRKENKEN